MDKSNDKDNSMTSLLDAFNNFFEGSAKAVVVGSRIEITIGSQTLLVSLPEIVGGQTMGLSDYQDSPVEEGMNELARLIGQYYIDVGNADRYIAELRGEEAEVE